MAIDLCAICGLRTASRPAIRRPHVRFQGSQINITTIVQAGDLLLPKTESFGKRSAVQLNISPEGHPEWAFTIRLRDTLTNDAVNYTASDKTIFISDIEGEFSNFRKLLLAAKVIDEQYNWAYGTGSLVIPGDLFDRGKDVVPELWLLYKLEDEARQAGGQTIIINGNHDMMNLSGDHRYTDSKYFKDAWLMRTDINGLFDAASELGRWLRTKNTIVKVGDVLVMHGGLSPAILQKGWSLVQLNDLSRPYYDAPLKRTPDSLQVLFGKDALFWYRGYFIGNKATMGLVDSTLKAYNCKWILVGHTIVKWNIASYYCGKVIGIDVDEHENNIQAALLENGRWSVIDGNGKITPLVYNPKNDAVKEKDVL